MTTPPHRPRAPTGEPPGDPLQRQAVRLAGLGLLGALLPSIRLAWPGSPIPWDAGSHARAMAFGFVGVFVLGFLLRILPRTRAVPLPHPRWAQVGLWGLAGTALADGAGLDHTVALACAWGASWVALARSLGAAWFAPKKAEVWFEPWLGGGLLGMAVSAAGAVVGLGGAPELAARAPAAFLIGGATPLALGLTVRMLPPMAGIGPPDRATATRIGRASPLLAGGAAAGVLSGWSPAVGAGVLAVAGLGLGAAWCLGGLRLRRDGEPAQAAARLQGDSAVLRATARANYAALSVGLVLLIGGGFEGAWAAGVHTIGLGFLAALALGVAQRIVPGFVGGDVRWPRLRALPAGLVFGALALRLGAVGHPALLLPAAALLACAWLAFALQIGPMLRAPAADREIGCGPAVS